MAKISVIVPVYNAERYLKQCIDSIVGQTLRDIEIILINDGSTDGSGTICRGYTDDERVIYIEKENSGAAAARQDGVERATGEYLGFVDADDWLEPDMYEKMYQASRENDADIVFCNCIKNENDRRYPPAMRSGTFDRQQILDEILPYTLAYIDAAGNRRNIRWVQWMRIYKRSLIMDNGIRFIDRFRRSQDGQFNYEATLAAQSYCYLGHSYLVHHRIVDDSLSRSYTKNLWQLYVPLIEYLYDVTERFTERDLMPQMHLRAFFFTVESILNEVKPTFPYDEEKRLELVREIVEHPICERYYGQFEAEKLNEVNYSYYQMIHQKDAAGLIRLAKEQAQKAAQSNSRYERFIQTVKKLPLIKQFYRKQHQKREKKRISKTAL